MQTKTNLSLLARIAIPTSRVPSGGLVVDLEVVQGWLAGQAVRVQPPDRHALPVFEPAGGTIIDYKPKDTGMSLGQHRHVKHAVETLSRVFASSASALVLPCVRARIQR